MVFVFQKYGKFWSVSVDIFIEHNPWNCKVCAAKNLQIAISEEYILLNKMFYAHIHYIIHKVNLRFLQIE